MAPCFVCCCEWSPRLAFGVFRHSWCRCLVIGLSFPQLSWSGQASGAWGGEVRVWDMRTGQAVAVLDEHENATSVCALPNGDLVTGSSGRQTAPGALPSQFRLRLWREGTMVKMVEDHTNSIKCLAVMPGIGFASSSNDGCVQVTWSLPFASCVLLGVPGALGLTPQCFCSTVRIRSHDMTALQTFETTKRVRALPTRYVRPLHLGW